MKIIGITGTLGAGKGTIVEYLVEQQAFSHYSVREYLKEILAQKGLEPNRNNLVDLANNLRKNHSPSYLIEKLYEKAIRKQKNCVIESIRTEGEVLCLRKKGNFTLFSVDADPELRYKRIYQRASETDKISFSEFLENEKREMTSSDPNKQNLRRCIELADIQFFNNGTVQELHHKVAEILNQ
jgi:dephospho-CoA kinase